MSVKNWQAQWSDGKTAATEEVMVKLTSQGLMITPSNSDSLCPRHWRFENLRSPDPITRNNRTALLTSTENPEHRLFINEPRFANSILPQAPQLGSTAHQWHLLKWPLGIAAAIVLFWGLTYLNIISPADRIAHLIPDNIRQAVGNNVVTYLTKDKKICSTKAGDQAFNKMMARLNQGIGNAEQYDIKIADLNIVNAFAAPGEKIIVSGKLIEEAESPDEVMGVIAHEVGHGIERHPEASIVRAFGLMALVQLMTAGEAGTLTEIALFLAQTSYSRSAEREADNHAARILQNINVDTRPLAGFFDRLINKEKSAPPKKGQTPPSEKKPSQKEQAAKENEASWFDMVSTHPPTKERIELFNSTARPTTPPILTDKEWQALQAICGSKTNKKSKTKQK